jgi:PqqD family protein of HPr-rel-A system
MRLNTATQLHWRHWNNEYLVFDLATGRTHVLSALTAGVLLTIEEGASNQAEVLAGLGSSMSVDGISDALPSILGELIKSSLIQPCLE